MSQRGTGLGPLHPTSGTGAGAGADRLAPSDLSRERQLELYRWLQLNRLVEDRLTNLYRQGQVVGGLYSSRGQEAVSVGSACALAPQDYLAPLIRNLGSMLVKGAGRGVCGWATATAFERASGGMIKIWPGTRKPGYGR